jgi:hypothetical protein
MANLVDIGNSTGIDLASDEALLTNDTGVACVEGGVYAVDPSSALMDVAGTYKWTSVKLSGVDDMRIGMFVVSRDAVRSSTQGQFVGHSQMRVLCSAENGVIVAGDLLVPVPGKTYLVRASDGDLVSRRPVGRAVVGMSATTPALTWCYFSGLAPFFGSANLSPGVVDEQMTTMFDKTTVLTNYFAYQNSDFQSNADTSWMVLPPAFIPAARLVNGALVMWTPLVA